MTGEGDEGEKREVSERLLRVSDCSLLVRSEGAAPSSSDGSMESRYGLVLPPLLRLRLWPLVFRSPGPRQRRAPFFPGGGRKAGVVLRGAGGTGCGAGGEPSPPPSRRLSSSRVCRLSTDSSLSEASHTAT